MTNQTAQYAALNASIEQARQGNSQAFAEVVTHTQNLVASITLVIVKDIRASEEVAQEAYLIVWQKMNTLRKTRSFLPWLRQITRHCAYQWLSKEHVRRTDYKDNLDEELGAVLSDESPEASLSEQQQQAIIYHALDKLPEQSRDVVLLYYREQQSAEHVADLLGITPEAVRQRLSRARKQLAQQLLSRVGKAALLSAPSISISTLLTTGAMVGSAPAAAAGFSLTSGVATSVKWLALLGAMAVTILGGLAGLFIGSHRAQKMASTDAIRQQLVRMRNQAAVFMIVVGSLFILSYEVDPGWLLPTLSYLVLLLGILTYQRRVQRLVYSGGRSLSCYLGLALGLGGGLTGFFAGLILSGRL